MLENAPTQSTLMELLGQPLFKVWQELCSAIDEKYDMERLWNTGGKNWTYEYKYRRGGKTLCSLYAKSNCVGFMIIFGKAYNRTEIFLRHSAKGTEEMYSFTYSHCNLLLVYELYLSITYLFKFVNKSKQKSLRFYQKLLT